MNFLRRRRTLTISDFAILVERFTFDSGFEMNSLADLTSFSGISGSFFRSSLADIGIFLSTVMLVLLADRDRKFPSTSQISRWVLTGISGTSADWLLGLRITNVATSTELSLRSTGFTLNYSFNSIQLLISNHSEKFQTSLYESVFLE